MTDVTELRGMSVRIVEDAAGTWVCVLARPPARPRLTRWQRFRAWLAPRLTRGLPAGRAGAADDLEKAEAVDNQRPSSNSDEALAEIILPKSPGELFHDDLVAGRLPIPATPALSVDVYAAFQEWRRQRGNKDVGVGIKGFLSQLEKLGIANPRQRYTVDGSIRGPHSVLMLGLPSALDSVLCAPDQCQRLGLSIARFKEALHSFKGSP